MAVARLLLLGALVALACGQPTSRILGGESADATAFPYAVSVRLDNAHVCGGSLIGVEASPLGTKHVLTAAHCVTAQDGSAIDSKRLSVRVGSTNQYAGGKLVDIAHVTVHPAYAEPKNNIAILTLPDYLRLTDRVRPIVYAMYLEQTPAVGSKVTTAGWGEQADGAMPYKLQHTAVTVASEAACTDSFPSNDDSILCLDHGLKQGSCKGDAGNGAVIDGVLFAVSNYIIGACGARYPDVYANVGYFGAWINSVVIQEA